jgi:hypothetical protein
VKTIPFRISALRQDVQRIADEEQSEARGPRGIEAVTSVTLDSYITTRYVSVYAASEAELTGRFEL